LEGFEDGLLEEYREIFMKMRNDCHI